MITRPIERKGAIKTDTIRKKGYPFLALFPIYKNELSYKARGTFKLEEKLRQSQITENGRLQGNGYQIKIFKTLRNENTFLQSTFGLFFVNVLYGAGHIIAKGVMPEFLTPSVFILLRVWSGLVFLDAGHLI